MRMLTAFLSVSLLLPSCSAVSATARHSIAYPTELQGMWDLGPQSCKLPLNPDSDSPIRIEKTRLRGYEHEEVPVAIACFHRPARLGCFRQVGYCARYKN